jgi:hypothetical protein
MNNFFLAPGADFGNIGRVNPQTHMNETEQDTTTTTIERLPDYVLYKANSRGSGGAFRFTFNPAKKAVFVEAAAQSGEKQFDWEKKVIMKWGLADLGQALAVMGGRQPQAKLFHQNERGNSTFELTLRDDPAKAPYVMMLSRQLAEDKSVAKVGIPASHGEVAVLETILRAAVARIIGW